MSTIKTLPNDASVEDFLNRTEDDAKRQDSLKLLDMYKDKTAEQPKMWGDSIVGFGMYHYQSERSSQQGDWFLSGFSPRKQNLTLYFPTGFDEHENLLNKLGKHKTSKSCLYINRLSDVDLVVLGELIAKGHADSKRALANQ